MRFDVYMKTVLTVIAAALLVIAMKPFFHSTTVNAATVSYSYLSPQAGNTEDNGKEFIDMRNGNDYDCTYKNCKLYGKFAFSTIP